MIEPAKKLMGQVEASGVMTRLSLAFPDATPEGSSSRSEDSSWAVSFADILATLLCFFILFFNVSRNAEQKQSILDRIIIAMTGEDGGKSPAVGQSGSAAKGDANLNQSVPKTPPVGAKTPSEGSDVSLANVKELLNKHGVYASGSERVLNVEITSTSMFDSGSLDLNETGRRTLEKFVGLIADFSGKIRIDVEGHADVTAVRGVYGRKFQDNMELSGLRAMRVRQEFLKAGFGEKDVVASALGHHSPVVAPGNLPVTDGAGRRVSFRIEEIR